MNPELPGPRSRRRSRRRRCSPPSESLDSGEQPTETAARYEMSSGQEQIRTTRKDDVEPVDAPVAAQAQTQVNTEAVDSILDDIDSVLESNAEEFVRNFVQKGGQ